MFAASFQNIIILHKRYFLRVFYPFTPKIIRIFNYLCNFVHEEVKLCHRFFCFAKTANFSYLVYAISFRFTQRKFPFIPFFKIDRIPAPCF